MAGKWLAWGKAMRRSCRRVTSGRAATRALMSKQAMRVTRVYSTIMGKPGIAIKYK